MGAGINGFHHEHRQRRRQRRGPPHTSCRNAAGQDGGTGAPKFFQPDLTADVAALQGPSIPVRRVADCVRTRGGGRRPSPSSPRSRDILGEPLLTCGVPASVPFHGPSDPQSDPPGIIMYSPYKRPASLLLTADWFLAWQPIAVGV